MGIKWNGVYVCGPGLTISLGLGLHLSFIGCFYLFRTFSQLRDFLPNQINIRLMPAPLSFYYEHLFAVACSICQLIFMLRQAGKLVRLGFD